MGLDNAPNLMSTFTQITDGNVAPIVKKPSISDAEFSAQEARSIPSLAALAIELKSK